MQTEVIQYKGWKCLKITNGIVDLIVTLDVGPRVIHFGFCGQQNEFHEFPDTLGATGGDVWHSFGGHRLWHAPEVFPRTYYPDNTPVKYEDHQTFIRFISDLEKGNDVQKEIEIGLVEGQAQVRINHRIRNVGQWPVEYAVWAITVMEAEGVAIAPMPPRLPHEGNFVPSIVAIWPVTNMADARFTWGREFILLRQDTKAVGQQKFGLTSPAAWGAYARKGHLFVKQVKFQAGANYPDGGCNLEFYNQEDMAEIESLAPLSVVQPNEASEHFELWTLLDQVPQPQNEADVKANVLPKIADLVANKI